MTEMLSMDEEFIKKLAGIVLANLRDEKFDVDKLATEAGMSRATLHRKLRSIKSQDISQFIREIRLQRAKEFLQQNAGTASEIAFMVGFGSPAYFNKCFHEYFGYPPGQIKKEGLRKDAEVIPDSVITPDASEKATWRSTVIPSLVILFLVVLLSGSYILFFRNSHQGMGSRKIYREKSIAVLPFINDSSSDSTAYFINGVMDEIINNLQKIKAFSKVLSRTSVEQYRGTNRPSLPKIAKELGVNYIVEGSGQRYGNLFHIRVRLFDATRDRQIWADSYEQKILETKDIFKIQNQIAQAIAAESMAIITPEEKKLIEKAPTSNLTGLDFYQRGKEMLGNVPFHDLIVSSTTYPIFFDDPFNKNSIDRAKLLFRMALRYDSAFAPAYVELAAIYWRENYFREYFSENYLDSVLVLINKALSYDDKLPDAYYIRAMYFGETGNLKRAREDFDKTLQLNPNHWQAYYGKGTFYLEQYLDADYTLAIGNFREAVSRYHGSALPYLLQRIFYALSITGFSELALDYRLKAAKLEVDSSEFFFALFEINNYAGNADKGFEFLQKAYNRDSTNIAYLWRLAGYYSSIGEFRESLKFYKKYLNRINKLEITMVNDIHRIGMVYTNLGLKDSAECYFKKQIDNCNAAIELKRPYGFSFAYYDLALIYASRGDKLKTIETLNIFKKREGMCLWFTTALQNEPAYRNFRNDPDLQKIFKEIVAKYQTEHEKVRKWLEANYML